MAARDTQDVLILEWPLAAPPTITSITPSCGPGDGGTPVTIVGTNFTAPATVTFGGKSAIGIVVQSSTVITCLTPSHPAGNVTVTVTDVGGTVSSLVVTYTIPGTAGPWNCADPTYPFLNTSYLGSGGPPISVPIAVGGYVPLSYISGLIDNHYSSGNIADPNGIPGTGGALIADFPGNDIFPYPTALSFCGGWADASGNLVAPPFFIGAQAILGPAPAGTTQLLFGVNDYPLADNTGAWVFQNGGYIYTSTPVAPTAFTPTFPPIKKQPFTLWGMEAKRADSITVNGIKRSVLDRIDTVTTLTFPFVPKSDLVAWKDFEQYALTGGFFTYRPILDYPNASLVEPMFEYPGTDSGDNMGGYSVVKMVSMDWTPKFQSQGIFSLDMKLRLVGDIHPAS